MSNRPEEPTELLDEMGQPVSEDDLLHRACFEHQIYERYKASELRKAIEDMGANETDEVHKRLAATLLVEVVPPEELFRVIPEHPGTYLHRSVDAMWFGWSSAFRHIVPRVRALVQAGEIDMRHRPRTQH